MRFNIDKIQREWLATVTTKLLLAIILLVGAISIFIYVFFPDQLENQSYRLLGEKAEGISGVTAAAISGSLQNNDKQYIDDILAQTAGLEDLKYAVVLDKDMQVFTSVYLPVAEKYNYYVQQSYKSISSDDEIFTVKRNIVYDREKIGTLYMGFSLEDANASISQSYKNATGIAMLFIVLGIIAALITKARIVTPIKVLNKAIQDFAAGNLSRRTDMRSMDEIGELSRSINAMVNNWESTQQEWGILNKGLEQRVSDRTRELEEEITERTRAEEELRFYMTKLENSNRELQDFAFVASHDLQEPLRKVQAFGDRLKAACGDELSEKAATYLDRMQSAAGRMQVLIKDLLTFSRVTSKARPFEPVEMNTIANEVLSDLEVSIERLKGKVEIGEIPNIQADPMQMRQLFQNLIGNALKFHKEGESPVVKVYAELLKGRRLGERDGREFCQLVFEDNGIGFDEKYTEKIFAVFQRLHGRSEYEGTGLGLAVCRKIVERHGGSIIAKSEPGNGAKFFITMPVTQDEPQVQEKQPVCDSPENDDNNQAGVDDKKITINQGMETSFMVPCP